jgi:predicted branched-subunit amino acid permease
MQFQPTPLNVTTLLVIAVGLLAGYYVSKQRYDSNLALFFYLIVLVFQNWSDRQVNINLFTAGLVMALLLRFEFMNPPLTKLVMVLEVCALAAINVVYLGHVFSL